MDSPKYKYLDLDGLSIYTSRIKTYIGASIDDISTLIDKMTPLQTFNDFRDDLNTRVKNYEDNIKIGEEITLEKNIVAPSFEGDLTGNATSATSATKASQADSIYIHGEANTNSSVSYRLYVATNGTNYANLKYIPNFSVSYTTEGVSLQGVNKLKDFNYEQ